MLPRGLPNAITVSVQFAAYGSASRFLLTIMIIINVIYMQFRLNQQSRPSTFAVNRIKIKNSLLK